MILTESQKQEIIKIICREDSISLDYGKNVKYTRPNDILIGISEDKNLPYGVDEGVQFITPIKSYYIGFNKKQQEWKVGTWSFSTTAPLIANYLNKK